MYVLNASYAEPSQMSYKSERVFVSVIVRVVLNMIMFLVRPDADTYES